MSAKTLDNCSLIKKYGKPLQENGRCCGLANGTEDDMCEICKECKLNTYYEDEYMRTGY